MRRPIRTTSPEPRTRAHRVMSLNSNDTPNLFTHDSSRLTPLFGACRGAGMRTSKKPWPTLPTDEAAEAFVETADLTEFDWSAAEPVRYEFGKKSAALNMRIPQAMLDAVKAKGIPFTRYVRMLIEQDLGRF